MLVSCCLLGGIADTRMVSLNIPPTAAGADNQINAFGGSVNELR
jgi:hypothetical protein